MAPGNADPVAAAATPKGLSITLAKFRPSNFFDMPEAVREWATEERLLRGHTGAPPSSHWASAHVPGASVEGTHRQTVKDSACLAIRQSQLSYPANLAEGGCFSRPSTARSDAPTGRRETGSNTTNLADLLGLK
ncbi:hypothetical protein NDU88_006518 [Pleurodeles waltl]|uniref:Uncharacterized protein n=1 Tax=Pleurodeles waltl TaxID=8319 RepID=A0AAV7WF12_PLEWA|nr:hypothetical protein NDU88_006518 [Pleurodeles waltl]